MKGNAICNTGPIIALSLLNRIRILQNLFRSVGVPREVHSEILEGGTTQAGVMTYQKAKWIKVIDISNPVDPLLATSLDFGEAAVISLANEIKADFVVIDEKKGRKIARNVYGIKVVGTARILVEAKRSGLIENVGNEILTLRELGYYIGDSVMEIALKKAGEI